MVFLFFYFWFFVWLRGEIYTNVLIPSLMYSFLGFPLRLLTRQFVIFMGIGLSLDALCHIVNAIHHMGGVFQITGEDILCFDKCYEICIKLLA